MKKTKHSPPTVDPSKLCLTEQEAGALLGISGRSLWTLAQKGQIEVVYLGALRGTTGMT